MNHTVSMVCNARGVLPVEVDSAAVLHDIVSGRWKAQVENVRRAYKQGGKAAAKELKLALPGILWSGRFSQRNASGLIQHSGLLVADLDELGDQLLRVEGSLRSSPHVYALFKSPTWTGLKAVLRVPADGRLHGKSFEAVRLHVRERTGWEIDPSGKDVTRICFVSFDPQTFVNAGTVAELTVPAVDEELGLPDGGCRTDAQTHRRPDSQTHMTPKSFSDGCCWVHEFLPTKVHDTNPLFFTLARKSRSVELVQGRQLSPTELWLAFKTWFDNSRPEFLSESVESYFEEFCRIRSYVRTPLDESPLQLAWKRANEEPLPPETSRLQEQVRRLAAFCAQLQLLAGTSAFYLSSHDAAGRLGVDPRQAHRWLRALEGQGLLRCERRGDPHKRLATEYRYMGTHPAPTEQTNSSA